MAEAVVLASGSGSNFEAIVHRIDESQHRVSALICDRPGAKCLDRATRLGVPSHLIPFAGRRQDAEDELSTLLKKLRPHLVVLAGFMKILPPLIVDSWENKMINIHPSLLPAYPGREALERSYRSEDALLGITVHYVDSGVDTGPIIQQHSITRDGMSLTEAEARIHELEHRHYPEVVVRLLDSIASEITEGEGT